MKPILFNTEMVKAILAGEKIVIRRIVKPQPPATAIVEMTDRYPVWKFWADDPSGHLIKPPYNPGDILYVRETWQAVYETEYDDDSPNCCVNIRTRIPNFDSIPKVEAGISSECSCAAMEPRMKYFVFKASDISFSSPENTLIWRPSIHMPKEAARLFLRVKNVRVERLRDITIQDAISEGCEGVICDHPNPEPGIGCTDCYNTGWVEPPIVEFAELWDSTIKSSDKAKYGWKANPWVWVIEFERCEKPVEGDDRE